MIYYLECDTAGNIDHIACSPMATIVPPVNMIGWLDPATKLPKVNAAGVRLSSYGLPLIDPVGIDADTYALIGGDVKAFTYDSATSTVVKRAVPNAPATP